MWLICYHRLKSLSILTRLFHGFSLSPVIRPFCLTPSCPRPLRPFLFRFCPFALSSPILSSLRLPASSTVARALFLASNARLHPPPLFLLPPSGRLLSSCLPAHSSAACRIETAAFPTLNFSSTRCRSPCLHCASRTIALASLLPLLQLTLLFFAPQPPSLGYLSERHPLLPYMRSFALHRLCCERVPGFYTTIYRPGYCVIWTRIGCMDRTIALFALIFFSYSCCVSFFSCLCFFSLCCHSALQCSHVCTGVDRLASNRRRELPCASLSATLITESPSRALPRFVHNPLTIHPILTTWFCFARFRTVTRWAFVYMAS